MLYEILVNTSGEHFKFYSIEYMSPNGERGRPTGRVFYGRIGSVGRIQDYSPDIIMQKRTEKISSHGYRTFAIDRPTPRLRAEEINSVTMAMSPEDRAEALDNAEELRQANREIREAVISDSQRIGRTRRSSVTSRVSARLNESSQRASQRVKVPSTNVPTYKVNRAGQIPKYREGYERQEPKNYRVVGKDELNQDAVLSNKMKQFYERIPEAGVVDKRPYGFDFDSNQIFGRYAGQFRFLLDESGEPVACFEITRDGKSNFLYIKTSQSDYISVLKYILSIMGVLTIRSPTLKVRVSGNVLINSMKQILPNASHTGRQKVTFTINKSEAIAFRTVQTFQRWEQ